MHIHDSCHLLSILKELAHNHHLFVFENVLLTHIVRACKPSLFNWQPLRHFIPALRVYSLIEHMNSCTLSHAAGGGMCTFKSWWENRQNQHVLSSDIYFGGLHMTNSAMLWPLQFVSFKHEGWLTRQNVSLYLKKEKLIQRKDNEWTEKYGFIAVDANPVCLTSASPCVRSIIWEDISTQHMLTSTLLSRRDLPLAGRRYRGSHLFMSIDVIYCSELAQIKREQQQHRYVWHGHWGEKRKSRLPTQRLSRSVFWHVLMKW